MSNDILAEYIASQLREMTEQEQRRLIAAILDHCDESFVIALGFAYEMTPGQKRGSKPDA